MAAKPQPDPEPAQSKNSEYTVGYSDEVAGFFGARRAATHAGFLLPYLTRGMRVLDAGCGPGSITIDLAELVAPGETIGIDVEESQIQRARQLAGTRGIDNVRFETGSLYQLPFPNEGFDAILLHGVIEHLSDRMQAIKEVRRVLKPGGIVGMRNGDWGAFLFAPRDALAHRFFDLLQSLMLQKGGDPYCGRNQLGLLRAAGFNRVVVSASFDCWTRTPASAHETAAFFAAHCRSPEFSEPVTASQLADRQTIEQIAQSFLEWGQDPRAFAAEAWGEVVAWKE